MQAKLKNDLPNIASEAERVKMFEKASLNDLNMAATQRLNDKYVPHGMTALDGCFTGGKLDPIPDICFVTTTEGMRAEQTSDLVGNSKVLYVGTLLDKPGSLRAGGPTNADGWRKVEAKMSEKGEKGKTVFVSMGTVTTADGPLGWQGSPDSALTGAMLCQSVWAAAFDALGGDAGSGNVILVTCGKDSSGKPRPLGYGRAAPGNAFVSQSLPQVDILTSGIDLFVTHGGQNSFVESITLQTPMLVVPTVGDQILNAEEAVKMGIGKKVSRPPPAENATKTAKVAAEYRSKVKTEILSMLDDIQVYKDNVVKASSKYRGCGVEAVIEVLDVAAGLRLSSSWLP